MKKVTLMSIILGLITVSAQANQSIQSDKLDISNKEKVVELLQSLETGDHAPISFINPNKYIQHNLTIADGLQGFGELMAKLPIGSVKANVVRAFQDGDYVFTHTKYNFFGPKSGFDIFRFENGKIVEHWDNLQELVEVTANGHTMFDGEVIAKDIDKTSLNKGLVKNFIETVLVDGHYNKLSSYFNGNDYIQHNPMVPDGVSGLTNALSEMAKHGIVMQYEKLHGIFGEGNFVLAISEGSFGGKHTSFYDLFRVENGFIAEHWDVIETIIPKEQWKNQNGKF